MNIRHLVRTLRRRFTRYEPLIDITISKENVLHNLQAYQAAHPSLTFAPVLKSNAYGHGLCVIAELLDSQKIAFFAVDSLYEARTLRKGGIKSRILLIGYVRPTHIARSSLPHIDYGIVDIEQLAELALIAKKPLRLHLKIDTGMHRQGILPSELSEALDILASNPNLRVVGTYSHFADADAAHSALTRKQIEVWNTVLAQIQAVYPDLEYTHLSATKGIPYSPDIHANVARLGIGLFGFDTAPRGEHELKAVLEMKTFITSVRDIPVGDTVGYNATFTAARPSRIATVPAGYFEGVNRALSNRGILLAAGQHAPIAGRVSMNMTSLDVTGLSVERGDEVVVISRDRTAPNSIEHLAKIAETTPYVLLTGIPQHLRRLVI